MEHSHPPITTTYVQYNTHTQTVGHANQWMVLVRVVVVVAVDPGIIIELLTGDNFSPRLIGQLNTHRGQRDCGEVENGAESERAEPQIKYLWGWVHCRPHCL